jgi:hypothetical protein
VFKWKSILDGRISRARINYAHRIPEPPRLSTFKRRGGGGSGIGGAPLQRSRSERPDQRRSRRFRTPPPAFLPLSRGGGVRNQARIFPTAEIKAPGSTTLRRSHPSQLLYFNQRGPFSPVAMCPPISTLLVHLIIHSPPATCSAPFHVSLPLKVCPLYLISCPLRLFPSAMCLPL